MKSIRLKRVQNSLKRGLKIGFVIEFVKQIRSYKQNLHNNVRPYIFCLIGQINALLSFLYLKVSQAYEDEQIYLWTLKKSLKPNFFDDS